VKLIKNTIGVKMWIFKNALNLVITIPEIQLILAITKVVFLSLYMLWGTRTGTCRVFVYLLLHGIPSEYRAVLYIVGKVFSRRSQRR